jgi:hypothetical protein
MDFKKLRGDVDELINAGVPTEYIDGYIRENGYSVDQFRTVNENLGSFTGSVKRGAKGIGSLLADIVPAMGGYVGEQIGIPGAKAFKERQMAEAAETQEEIAKFLPTKYESYQDVSSPLDALGYAKEAVGEAIPSILPSVVTGGAAGVVGRGAVAKAGQIASEQAKKRVLAGATPEELVSGLATQQAAKSGSLAATQAMARKQLGQEALGAFTGSAALNVPEAFQSIYSETGQEQLLPALVSGGFNAVLDAITPLSLLRTAKGKGLSNRDIVGAWYARGAKELGKGVLTEGATESLQEMTNAAAVSFVDENKDFFTPENLTRFIDAGLKGGIGGGAIQGAFGVAFGKKAPEAAAPLPPTPGPGPLTPAQAGAPTITPDPLQTPLKTTGEAGPIPAAERDIFGGVVPGTELKAPTTEMRPVLDENGMVVGYEPVAAAEAGPELTGEQTGLEFGGQQELFEGAAPKQPAQTPPAPLPEAEPAKPIGERVQDVVAEAKKDPTASKILKANNPASAKVIADRIAGFMGTPDADPVAAMEALYEQDRTGKYPAGIKALSDAQRELLETTYRRVTGRDIEDAIKERAFMGATQADLFTEPAEAPAATPTTPPTPIAPEAAWGEHKNDDHPAYADLGPAEKEAWDKIVASGRGNAVNFQDIVQAQEERIRRESVRTPEQVAEATERHKRGMDQDIESQLKGKSFEEALKFVSTIGPEANREIIRKMMDRVKELKRAGYRFTFSIADTPARATVIGGFTSSGVAGRVRPDFVGKHMDISLAGKNSGQSFGSDIETFTHESLHAITCAIIELGESGRGTEAHKITKDLDALYKHVYKYLQNKIDTDPQSLTEFERDAWAGYNNALGNKPPSGRRYNQLHEIVSWTMTNGDMMRTLENIPYKGKSAFTYFVEAIRKLLGLSAKSDTALSELLRLTQRLLEAPVSEISQVKPSGQTRDFTSTARNARVTDTQMDEVHNAQRFGEGLSVVPEDMFQTKDNPGINFGTAFQHAAEHIGDLVHRLSSTDSNQGGGHRYGMSAALSKASSRYSFGDLLAQVRRNYDYFKGRGYKGSLEAFENEFKAAAARYADAYNQVPTYTELQELGKQAAIALGEFRFIDAQAALDQIVEILEGPNAEEAYFRPKIDPANSTSQIPLDAQYDSQVAGTPTPAPAPGPTVVPAPGQPYTLPKLTKLQPSPTAGQQVKNVTQKITNAWNDDGFWTRFRIAAVDPTAGLAKTLSSLPLFQNGQLRADMLIRSFNQVINLIKNGIQSGIPVVNADGTVIIQQDANNLARSQIIADGLDNNPIVKGSGFSGRGFIGEISRIKRGEEIMAEDARLRAKGALMMAEAKAKMAQAKYMRGTNAAMGDIIKLVNQAKALRREGSKIKDINREKQVTQAHIDWADAQIKAVPETQEVFDIWRATNRGLIDLWESAGLLTAAEAANYRQKTSYVPLYAAREDLAFDEQEAYTGKGTGTKSVRLLDRLEGSDLQRNIWENMDKHYASMTAAAFQNQTRRVAVEQLQTVGAAKISTTDDNPAVNLRYKDPSHPNANQHGVVSVILDNPNDLAAFQMMHYELGPLMKGLSATTQALRATALINPMYWIKQLIRDPIHASIVANTGIVTPFHSAKEYINILANNSEEALLLARRGVIGQIDSTMDLADFLKQVGTEKLNPSKLDALIHKVMRMHEASDAATRVAIYKKAKADGLAQGMSEKEATDYGVFKSRESINFAVRGNSKTLNALRHMIPFFSAAITGLDTLYRAASGYGLNPEEKKAAQQLFIKRAGMMAMLSVAYAMILQDDEDYQKLPDNVKDNNWLLPNPFGGGQSFIKIAIPYEVGFLFKTVPEASVRYLAGTSTGKEVLASYVGGLKRNLPGEGVLIPQAAKPALEAITNYSFFTGRGIEGMSDQGLPVAQRGPNASEVAKTLSKAGLDKIGISPAKFDHLMQGYFAELGTFSTGMAGAAIAAATGKEPPAKNIEQMPFFKSFMTNPNTSKAATDFYEIMGAAQETVNAVNRMKKEGRIQEAKEFLSDEDTRKLAAVAPAMRKVQENMAKIRARVNQIEASKGMDPETKRVQINKLMEMYDKTARQGYMITQKAGIQR